MTELRRRARRNYEETVCMAAELRDHLRHCANSSRPFSRGLC